MELVLRAILFDFNGVLVDDEAIHCSLLRRIFAEEGLQIEPSDDLRRFVGHDDRTCFRRAFHDADRPLDDLQLLRLVVRKASYYQDRVRAEGFPFFEESLAFVRQARERDITLGVVSGALRAEIEGALRQAGIDAFFKTIVSSEDMSENKPHPAGYVRALEELNSLPPLPERLFHPHEVLAIEDTPVGIAAAAAAGVVTLAVTSTHSAAELADAEMVVESLAGLTIDALGDRLSEAMRA